MNFALLSHSESDTQRIGAALGEALMVGDVVALCGELGAGKTRLTQGVARGLGVDAAEPIVSPTFVLVREYLGRTPLFHLDAYRLTRFAELIDIGWEEMRERGAIVLEWSDRFEEVLELATFVVVARHLDETTRAFSIEARDERRVPRFPVELEAPHVAVAPPRRD